MHQFDESYKSIMKNYSTKAAKRDTALEEADKYIDPDDVVFPENPTILWDDPSIMGKPASKVAKRYGLKVNGYGTGEHGAFVAYTEGDPVKFIKWLEKKGATVQIVDSHWTASRMIERGFGESTTVEAKEKWFQPTGPELSNSWKRNRSGYYEIVVWGIDDKKKVQEAAMEAFGASDSFIRVSRYKRGTKKQGWLLEIAGNVFEHARDTAWRETMKELNRHLGIED